MGHVEMSGGHPPSSSVVRAIVMREASIAMTQSLAVVQRDWQQRANRAGARRTGTYLRSITFNVTISGGIVLGVIGSRVRHAEYLERGTGLYGPRHQWIVPKSARALRFPAGGGHTTAVSGARTFRAGQGLTLSGRQRSGRAGKNAGYIFARRVRGIMPRHYAHDAVVSTRGHVEQIFAHAGARIAHEIARAA